MCRILLRLLQDWNVGAEVNYSDTSANEDIRCGITFVSRNVISRRFLYKIV